MANLLNMSGGSLLNKGLPYDAEIEYLESTGTQWIETGFIPLVGDSIHTELSISTFPSFSTPFSAGTDDYQVVCVFNTKNLWVRFFRNLTPDGPTFNLQKNRWYTLDVSANGDVSFGGFTWSSSPMGELDGNNTDLWLYTRHNNNNPFIGKIKNFIIECNGKSRLYLIPVRVGQTGYLYDKVSGQIFGNAGTGNFILGPDKH